MSYPAVIVKCMFDTLQPGADPGAILSGPGDDGPAVVPLERLEAQICELAGHLAAATCRFLVLLGDFDRAIPLTWHAAMLRTARPSP